MDQHWKIVQSSEIVKDRWLDLRADRCVTPGGAEISPFYVLSYPDWVNVVAITPDDQLVLVRQYRHGAGKVCLELPAGGVEASETPLAAAQRELAEETGYTATTWHHVVSLFPNPSSHTNSDHTFLALDALPAGKPKLEAGEEGLVVELHSLAQIVENIPSGVLDQAMHVSALLTSLLVMGRLKL